MKTGNTEQEFDFDFLLRYKFLFLNHYLLVRWKNIDIELVLLELRFVSNITRCYV